MIIVSDTSPISNLLLIDQIQLLPDLYEEVLLPTGVAEELRRMEAAKDQVSRLLQSDWITVKTVADRGLYEQLRLRLDYGESEAIALAVELQADLLLIDETKGRRVAKSYGLPITGLLGVLLEAKAKGTIASVRSLMDQLIEVARFYIHPTLYQSVLQLADEADKV